MNYDKERNKQIRWNKKEGNLTNSLNIENIEKYNLKYNENKNYNQIINLALIEFWEKYL